MNKSFNIDTAQKILTEKRRLLGRGLSYAEKILFLHEAGDTGMPLTPGMDQIRLYPDRVAMQDATAQMAMLQFMQAGQERTRVEATIHCDHLITAEKGAKEDLERARIANREIYDFLSSGAAKYGIGFWAPGSGIIHQVILENYAVPGRLMIGTDSHTPNAGGMGMLAIGVGGADAAEAMAGLPWETRFPYIVGVRLSGRLRGWATAKDLILEMLRRFTVKGGTNKIFEYFGEGAEDLSVTQKATITNMGAELGATTSVFVYDDSMDAYLRNAGRAGDADEARASISILCQDEDCRRSPEKVFSELVEIDLGSIRPSHSGPFTPDRVTPVDVFKVFIREETLPEDASAVILGSCTNSSYSDLHAAAHILEEAGRHGIKAKVPFLLSPGSIRVYETIRRDGILERLVNAGAVILTASCGPCIGQWDRLDMKDNRRNCIFTTFNRNFRARNDGNPDTNAFLTSPVMAACIAVSGRTGFNPETDSLKGADGIEFRLTAPEPPPFPETGLSDIKGDFTPPSEGRASTDIKLDPASDRIELLKPFDRWDGRDFIDLPVLVKTRGKTTTDHISPGGKWLKYRGHITNISENMLEGAVNAYTDETGAGTNIVTGEKGVRFPELARYYNKNEGGFIIMGDDNYGEGSSREHAAMSPRFLGARAVIVRSFARIHEANLKKQGILALTFDSRDDYERIKEYDRISLVDLKDLAPGRPVKGVVKGKDGSSFELTFNHTFTGEQIGWFKAGSALNTMNEVL